MKSTKTKTYLVTLTLTDFHLFLDLFLLYLINLEHFNKSSPVSVFTIVVQIFTNN